VILPQVILRGSDVVLDGFLDLVNELDASTFRQSLVTPLLSWQLLECATCQYFNLGFLHLFVLARFLFLRYVHDYWSVCLVIFILDNLESKLAIVATDAHDV